MREGEEGNEERHSGERNGWMEKETARGMDEGSGWEGERPQVCLGAVSGVRGEPGVAFPVELITGRQQNADGDPPLQVKSVKQAGK